MVEDITIINKGLRRIKQQAITNLNDGTTASNEIRAIWQMLINDELQDFPYTWAQSFKVLNRLSNETDYHYDYVYQLPSDIVQLHGIYEARTDTDYDTSLYSIRGGRLYTNLTVVTAEYTRRVEETSDWSAHFDNMMAARVSKELCIGLAGTPQLLADLNSEYIIAQSKARHRDASQSPQDIGFKISVLNARKRG